MDGFRAEPFCTQLQAIGHNAHTTQGHGGPDEHRIEQKPGQRIEHASGDRHADQVVDKRLEKVLPNGAHGRGRKADRRGDLRQVGRKNRDLLHVDRNVAPLPHGNAQISLRQHRTVVDAIPDHCDTATMAANSFVIRKLQKLSVQKYVLSIHMLPLTEKGQLKIRINHQAIYTEWGRFLCVNGRVY